MSNQTKTFYRVFCNHKDNLKKFKDKERGLQEVPSQGVGKKGRDDDYPLKRRMYT